MYHSPLPTNLDAYYVYTPDGGHSINCLLAAHLADAFAPGNRPRDFLVPVPVKTVLRSGYTIANGHVVVDLLYDSELGLATLDEDTEL